MKPIASYLEATILKPTLVSGEVEALCEEALQYRYAGVCVPPYWVKKAKRDLQNADIGLVTVVGFPLGYQRSEVKEKELQTALADGATELDIVMNLSAFKTGVMVWVKGELAHFSKIIHQGNCLMKVILETAYLTDEEIIRACQICEDAGADFVKTSTGFAPEGASERHVRLMRRSVSERVGVKASGGIKTLEQALKMIEAGADRIGTSSALNMVKEEMAKK